MIQVIVREFGFVEVRCKFTGELLNKACYKNSNIIKAPPQQSLADTE